MFYACVQRFNMTKNFEKRWEILGLNKAPSSHGSADCNVVRLAANPVEPTFVNERPWGPNWAQNKKKSPLLGAQHPHTCQPTCGRQTISAQSQATQCTHTCCHSVSPQSFFPNIPVNETEKKSSNLQKTCPSEDKKMLQPRGDVF